MDDKRRQPKVALVIKHLAGRSGGAERIYCEQANFLAENGYDVSCVVFDPPGPGPFYELHPSVELVQIAGGSSDRVASLLKSLMKLLPKDSRLRDRMRWNGMNRQFVARLRRYFEGAAPDVVISLLPSANTPTLVAAKDQDVKVIVTNHNVPKEDYTNPNRWGGGEYDRALRLKSLDRADGIHVLFPRFATWFPQHLQNRIKPIPNYVSAEILNADLGSAEREKVIIGVGRLSRDKNYWMLLEAWEKLGAARGDWQVRLFGDGPLRKKMQARIDELGLKESFRLMGVTRDISEEYGRSAFMCHPAEYEGFGLSPAEALACKVPVLAFAETPGIEEFLVDGQNAVLVPREGDRVEALTKGLRRLMDDPALRKELAENGPASVSRFDKETYVQNWIGLIETVLSEEKNAQP